jgi:cytochrome o ubiquinol oxidase subunit 2
MNKENLNGLLFFNRFYGFLQLFVKWIMIVILPLSMTACKMHLDGILNPKGIIAYEERKLFFDTLALMLIVVLPVIVMSLAFIYHYRASHQSGDYKPNWSHSYFLESLWWGIPCVIILILAILTWKKTYQLDPYQKITSQNKSSLLIQVIALPWKWLFIYPEQNIATINYLQIPVGQDIEYLITTDNVPMSAFFIPKLGSQIYAMAGMQTRLHLLANELDNTMGMNTLFNGEGFADMRFSVHIVPADNMEPWFNTIKKTSPALTQNGYIQLLIASTNEKPQFFSTVPENLFQNVIMTYMNSSGTLHPRENQAKFNYIAK